MGRGHVSPPPPPVFLADQLILSQPGGQIMPTTLLLPPPPSDFQTFLTALRVTQVINGLDSSTCPRLKTYSFAALHTFACFRICFRLVKGIYAPLKISHVNIIPSFEFYNLKVDYSHELFVYLLIHTVSNPP